MCLLSQSMTSIDYYAVRLVLSGRACVCEHYLTTEAKYPNLFAIRTSAPRYAYMCYSERCLKVCLLWIMFTLLSLICSHVPPFLTGLRLAEQLARREDEAKICHRLGLSLWASGNLEEAQHQVKHLLPRLLSSVWPPSRQSSTPCRENWPFNKHTSVGREIIQTKEGSAQRPGEIYVFTNEKKEKKKKGWLLAICRGLCWAGQCCHLSRQATDDWRFVLYLCAWSQESQTSASDTHSLPIWQAWNIPLTSLFTVYPHTPAQEFLGLTLCVHIWVCKRSANSTGCHVCL